MAKDRRERLVAGAMTGTSLDGIDVALVSITGAGRALRATLRRHLGRPLGALGDRLRPLAEQQPVTAAEVAALARDLGVLHADVLAELTAGGPPLDLVAAHGQTVHHAPPLSWQLLDPAPIARRLGCPVVFDLRAADLAAGGQGAPITPVADAILFRSEERCRAIVNLGGFCNVTVLPAGRPGDAWDTIRGYDVCACNLLLDAIAREVLGVRFDHDGRAASAGTADPGALASLDEILAEHARSGRSLGTGDEAAAWLGDHRVSIAPNDLAATAVRAIAGCVASRVACDGARDGTEEIVLAGGGARNLALVRAIESACAAPVIPSDEIDVPAEAREAIAMAVLGALCADGVPITLPQVTGCSEPAPIAGRWCLPARAP